MRLKQFVLCLFCLLIFAFAERQLMEECQNHRLLRDEALHLTGTQHILNIMAYGNDPEMAELRECRQEAYELFKCS